MSAGRPGQAAAADRWDSVDGIHTWAVLDRVEVLAASEGERAEAWAELEHLGGLRRVLAVFREAWDPIAREERVSFTFSTAHGPIDIVKVEVAQ